uniref:Acylsugar acyltransferase 3-like n=1 Tax=Tanacetum cinerariifolium TaxID=118510 RepID=A0A6L2MC41_TANCI|nr:acylsugar acyltransferase 3-like [Tanacetum cinerariifolium]
MIISQETIKPSSPTPPHLITYNLSLADRLAPSSHVPFIFFYKNYNNRDINILKKSLSECLTQYYPFAGRLLTPSAPGIECRDHGVEFLEVSTDYRLHDFILNKEQDETLDKLIPNNLGFATNKTRPNMVEVQLNHFACGGVALAVATSHKVADALTMANFINHWATVARGGSRIKPSILSHSLSNPKLPEFTFRETSKVKQYATRRFMFPDSKLNGLKNKVNGLSTTPVNPTRKHIYTSEYKDDELRSDQVDRYAYTYPPLPRVPLSYQASASSLSTLHFLKFPEKKLESMKILDNKLKSLKL